MTRTKTLRFARFFLLSLPAVRQAEFVKTPHLQKLGDPR